MSVLGIIMELRLEFFLGDLFFQYKLRLFMDIPIVKIPRGGVTWFQVSML
jgi:hypothetical protein